MGFADDHLISLVDAGLGNRARLVDPGDGRAPSVDASRDPRAFVTPGHTDEDLPFLLRDGSRRLGVFTGGSLIVNSAARAGLALDVEPGSLAAHAADAPAGAHVGRGHGERAMTAASVLERAGRRGLTVLDGGPADYAATHGRRLAEGTAR